MNTQPEGTKPQFDPTKIGPCESCGANGQWVVQEPRYVLSSVVQGNRSSAVAGGPAIPVLVVVCGNCANVRLIAAEAYA
jgi:hypothetical protein